jgi:dihydroorotase (multifunctional complex type)
MPSLLVKNAKLWFNNGFVEANIEIEDGVITAITKSKLRGKYDEVIDARHEPVIPGVIDIHAHVYDPEYTSHEDWSTGSLAALYGGITTVFDMPLRVYVDSRDMVKKKIEEARKNSYINYGIIAGFMNENNYKRIPELADEGVKAYKIFTARPFKPVETAYPYILDMIANVDGVAVFHAEDDAFIEYGEYRFREQDDPEAYHKHRTPYAEAAAIIRVGLLASEIGTRIHIAHLSSKEGLEALRYIRERGARVTAEVTPHHLYFTRESAMSYRGYLKVAPTLKSSSDVEALWRGIARGDINAYVSDNAPSPRELKEKNIWEAWGGIPNLEIMIPFLYTYGVRTMRISFERFVEVTSREPARIMNIYPEKGEICVGCDADLVVLDTMKPYKYDSSKHHHKVDWSPWDGLEFYGTPLHVIINGEVMIKDHELVGKPGKGRYVGKKK